MKAAEKNAKRRAHYDHLERAVDAEAVRRFHEPAGARSKITAIASAKIIQHYIDRLDDSDREDIERIARKCMRGGDTGGDDGKRKEESVPAKIPGM